MPLFQIYLITSTGVNETLHAQIAIFSIYYGISRLKERQDVGYLCLSWNLDAIVCTKDTASAGDYSF